MKTTTGTVGYDRTTGTLRLTVGGRTTEYQVEEFDTELGGRAFALVKVAGGEAVERYDVLVGTPGGHDDCCSCPDSTYRRRACKHYKAVAALLAAGRLGGVPCRS